MPEEGASLQAGPFSQRAIALQSRVQVEIGRWSSLFPSGTVAGTSACVAASCPQLGLDDQSTLAQIGLWIFGADDLFESPDLDDSALELRRDQYVQCSHVHLPPEVGYDPLARMLVDIARELEARSTDSSMLGLWRAELQRMLEAMIRERSLRTGDQLGLDDYLDVRAQSIGVGLAVSTGWILLGARPGSNGLAALRRAERAVRLANDLRSWEREANLGQANALDLVSSCDEVTLASRSRSELAQMRLLLERERPRRAADTFLERFATVLVDLYAEADLRAPAIAECAEVACGQPGVPGAGAQRVHLRAWRDSQCEAY